MTTNPSTDGTAPTLAGSSLHANRISAAPKPRAHDRVLQQAGDRHRADAARYRRHVRRDVGGTGVDVTDEPGLGSADADVDHRRARLDHVRRDDARTAGGDDENVG